MTRFWVGGYGADMDGAGEGIGLLAGSEGRALRSVREPVDGQGPIRSLAYRGAVVPAASPSWLAQHPTLDVVYAALEGTGEVAAFARAGESALRPLGAPVPAGKWVCHLAVSPDGRFLLASCYGDGRVVRIGLGADGGLLPAGRDKAAELRAALFGEAADGSEDSWREESRSAGETPGDRQPDGPSPAIRPAGVGEPAVDPYASDPNRLDPNGDPRVSHAHSAAFLPDGRIATTDLGYDLIRIWRASTGSAPGTAGLTLDHEVVLPRGSGPRHMVVHPSGHLHVVTEYSCELFTLAADRLGADGTGRWGLVASTAVSAITTPGHDYPAELSRSRDGETLYAGVRGSNTIAALRVRGSGAEVEPLALVDSGVDWPRHHLVHDGALLVAGQRSDEITVLDLDDRTGIPGRVRHRTPAPAPTHLLRVR